MHKLTQQKKLKITIKVLLDLVLVGYATKDPYKLALGADARLQYDLTKDTSNF
jgi:hypothetical protein